jgi:hypothetical protein
LENRKLLAWIGFALYGVSLFLPALSYDGGLPGMRYVWQVVVFPTPDWNMLSNSGVQLLNMLGTNVLNLLVMLYFLFFVTGVGWKTWPFITVWLLPFPLFMFFCWNDVVRVELGYYGWVAGISMILFSAFWERSTHPERQANEIP